MKNSLLLFILCLSINISYSQNIKDVFTSSKISMDFVGLDFSHVKLVGSEGFNDPSKIQNYYFGTWNGLLISEIDKYDVKKSFMKRHIDYDLSVVERVNDEVDYIDLVTNKTPKAFSEEKIQSIINQYETKDLENEFGLSFVVHSLNKFQERAYIYVVIFDTKSKKVLFYDKMSGEAGGFGFRNYWARSIYNILNDIANFQFRKWKRNLVQK
ncbi:hypothetical protein [Aureispira anguillae]|uniref:Uncharacterized protein n=1 Tax=Aureispira anguillae TaxID=2864201 RepID=A0A916DXC9_9BACT|nr:hypothetical protein [Aureispira anguillae]BDS15625.1 hypothetical protein AsAng_0064090 [Aureispira anguillae]